MGATPIQWTDHSLNPIRARRTKGIKIQTSNNGHYCEKVSKGCKNCYSSKEQPRFGLPVFQEARGNPDIEHFFDGRILEQVLRRKKPTKWFWCDMTDMFGHWVKFEWIAACFGVMAATPQHTHQILTKRPGRALEFFRWLEEQSANDDGPWTTCLRETLSWLQSTKLMERLTEDGIARDRVPGAEPWPLPNVWLGTSAEDQEAADERVPLLLRCPAAVHWVSAEPLLGPLDLSPWLTTEPAFAEATAHALGEISVEERIRAIAKLRNDRRGAPCRARISWVVVGGESGSKARPFDIAWCLQIIWHCRDAGAAAFVKQLGARPFERGVGLLDDDDPDAIDVCPIRLKHKKGGDMSEWSPELRIRQYPKAAA